VTINEPAATADFRATVTGGTGPDLSGFPLLAYVPGEGVRVASTGVRAVRVAIDAHLDIFARVAAKHGITAAEAEQAYRFYTRNDD
jgi:hypothetical protein